MRAALILFVAVYLLNVIPAFAPPTWMVFSYIGFRYPTHNVALFAIAGSAAAMLGRITLAKMARVIIRQRFMSESSRANIDAIRARLEKRRMVTFSVLLFYAFTPLPSNYVFLAYGLTTMELKVIAAPFFLGRAVSYGFWGLTSAAVSRRVPFETGDTMPYFGVYFVLTQLALLAVVYGFMRIDWRILFSEKKLRWAKKQ